MMKCHMLVLAALGAAHLPLARPASAQNRSEPGDQSLEQIPQSPPLVPLAPAETGRLAESAVGRVGERQTREQVANVEPIGRINSRINTRISLRIHSRIDRNYDPRPTLTSSIEVAEDQVRRGGRR
jgi:hypothetical protein